MVSVTDDAPGSPQAISVQASVVVPPPPPPAAVVSLAPSTLTFPSQYVGTSGLPQTVTVTNSGNASSDGYRRDPQSPLTSVCSAIAPAQFAAEFQLHHRRFLRSRQRAARGPVR